MSLKLLLRDNQYLYSLYSNFRSKYLKESRTNVVVNTNFCIESVPSSANTFFQYFMRYMLPEAIFAHHTHSLGTIKAAISKKVPIIILIRNPLDAVSSRTARFDDSIEEGLLEYVKFYKFIENNNDKFFVLTFEEIVNLEFDRLFGFLDKKCVKYDVKFIPEAIQYAKRGVEYLGDSEKRNPLPNKSRNSEKERIKKNILMNNQYLEAEEIYTRIINNISGT